MVNEGESDAVAGKQAAKEEKKLSRCALVTGANKGIGYGLVRALSKKFKGTVYLTARDKERGQEAQHALSRDDRLCEFLQLDVKDRASIEKVRDVIMEKHGGLDLLIQNAGIVGADFYQIRLPDGPMTPPRWIDVADNNHNDVVNEVYSAEVAEDVVQTDFFGALNVAEILFPLLRSHARVVYMSSGLGSLRNLEIVEVKKRLVDPELSVEELKSIANDYLRVAKEKDPGNVGYPKHLGPYSFSKMCLTVLTRLQQRDIDKDESREDIIINACTPGFVATEMTSYKGTKTIEEALDTPLYLAFLPPGSGPEQSKLPRGAFVRDLVEVDWIGERDSSFIKV
ncbi:hypothetical protein RvY_00406 [Ramazzottius varieornatus]|uniref:Uncharacterized protein n=1 Tax=Ramazzottius varieornatus TaxID=947166 RepID=A0A1D1UGB4_RAMVA|nr:hypothetical protein RvY_00406 [Ramazzottius varieornatus]